MNNYCLPDWNFENDLCINSQKNPLGPEQELVELLWQNGQVVLHSQNHQKPTADTVDERHVAEHEQPTSRASGLYGISSSLIQEDETVSWIQYPVENSFEKDFSSSFLSELPCSKGETAKPFGQFEEGKFYKLGSSNATHMATSSKHPNTKSSIITNQELFSGNPMPPPKPHVHISSQPIQDLGGLGKVVKFSHITESFKGASGSSSGQYGEKGPGNLVQGDARESSAMTVGSSHCGSNLVPQDFDVSRGSSNGVGNTSLSGEPSKDDFWTMVPQSEKGKAEAIEPTATSSSGGSGSSFGRGSSHFTGDFGLKRKRRHAEESENQSEATELKSASRNKAPLRTGSSRRIRPSEVHNLSERRRRDRINEKMRALQELLPHCTKTDKASMLDEAIEYLKSLQLQLQVMWMGTGVAPMMFPGVPNYISHMGVGIGPPSLHHIYSPVSLQRVPLVDQPISMAQTQNRHLIFQTPVLNPVNYQNQMQNSTLSEQYARFMGFNLKQTATEPMNVFRYNSHPVCLGQTILQPSNGSAPAKGGTNPDDAANGKIGQ